MSLWDWAVAAYARPGVEALALDLQDQRGQCVAVLLWAAWAARTGRRLDERALARGAALAKGWEAEVSRPLRSVRRVLKAPAAGVADVAREALRAQVKAAELAGEQVLLEALETIADGPAGAPADLGSALAAAAAAWGGVEDPAAIKALARLLTD